MDLETAFLDDIVAHPDDPTPWLVFADWLTERDDPRGELVRLLRLCWDEPKHEAFDERHAALEALFARGVRLPVPRTTNSLGMELVWVPPGRVWFNGANSKPGRKRAVTFAEPFWLSVHPVTQEQWRTLMPTNPSGFARGGENADRVADIADADLACFPVERITWHEAEQFLKALNARERSREWVYRLPTEYEWEYAVRSPVTCRTDCGFSFYFAVPTNELTPALANYRIPEDGLRRTTRVGSYPPTRLGLYDVHGNVMEWCGDTVDETRRRLRGGHWDCAAAWCKAGFRDAIDPGARRHDLGFRVARVRR